MQYVKIPDERIGILIGEGGREKRNIEKRTGTKITVCEGEVTIEGEPVDEWLTKDIVKAIGRGFSPEKALILLGEENIFEMIDLKDFTNTDKSLLRKKGRIIGAGGKTRRALETLTNTYVSVYGKTIGILGDFSGVALAKEAIVMLLNGSSHTSAYKFLERSASSQRGLKKF